LALGEKLWELRGTANRVAVKSTGPEGTKIEQNSEGEIVGFGRGQGVDGKIGLNVEIVQGADTTASGTGLGTITTKDGEVITLKYSVVGVGEMGKGIKALAIAVCSTSSKKWPWINGLMIVGEAYRNAAGQEILALYEWK